MKLPTAAKTDTSPLEREIDELVYAIGGLTPGGNRHRARRSQVSYGC